MGWRCYKCYDGCATNDLGESGRDKLTDVGVHMYKDDNDSGLNHPS